MRRNMWRRFDSMIGDKLKLGGHEARQSLQTDADSGDALGCRPQDSSVLGKGQVFTCGCCGLSTVPQGRNYLQGTRCWELCEDTQAHEQPWLENSTPCLTLVCMTWSSDMYKGICYKYILRKQSLLSDMRHQTYLALIDHEGRQNH
jgi:hypothetical protein